MSISTRYHVSVEIHQKIYRQFGHTKEYEEKTLAATKGSEKSGSCFYDNDEHWAIFDTLKAAQECERRLMDVGYYFAGKLLGEETQIPETPQ